MALISLLALPQALLAFRILRKGRNRSELARGVPATSNLHWYFGVLLAVGVASAVLSNNPVRKREKELPL